MLLLALGGMKSSITYWDQTPWDPRVALAGQFRVIAMDQRNAGKSSAPVSNKDGWHSYTNDQLALMDYLSIERFTPWACALVARFVWDWRPLRPSASFPGLFSNDWRRQKPRHIFSHV